MDFKYEEALEKLNNYIENCRKIIYSTFFDEEKNNGFSTRQNLIEANKIPVNSNIQDAIKYHKNNMIDIKLNHTMRVVSDVEKISLKIGSPVNFTKVVKTAALLHDIARFNQAVWAMSFMDKECKEFEGMYHAEYGYKLLYMDGKINQFGIPNKYKVAIGEAVKYHQIPILNGDLALKINYMSDLDVDKYLTGSNELNQSEKIITAALVQMVKDVDMLDILYQHLTGEFPTVRPSVKYDILNDSLSDISKYWGISEHEIMEYNGLESTDINHLKTLDIPMRNVETSKLEIPKDIQDRFFANENMDLKELQNRRDWTFITGMWWRLNHFLNNINFTSNLEVVEENKLLENIYQTYPDKYKPLVEPAFEFAKEYLLEKKIKENEGNIYIK